MIGVLSSVAFVPTTDLDRAEQFYAGTLGFVLRDERPFALSAEIGGAQLRLTLVEQLAAPPFTVFGLIVADIEAAADELEGRGVRFTRYEGMQQDARGIWESPSGARVMWFLDPDGNNLSLTQNPAS